MRLVATELISAKAIRQTNPAHISFFVPNREANVPNNRLMIEVVTNLKVLLSENVALGILSASVIAVRYRLLPLLHSPRLVKAIRKHSHAVTHE